MNDTEYGLYRALYFYKKTRDDNAYKDVLAALGECIDQDCNAWMSASIKGIEGYEIVRPGIITDDDGLKYYILCPAEDDMSNMEDQGLEKLHVNLRAVLASIDREPAIAGICLNPWDGGCFVKAEEMK